MECPICFIEYNESERRPIKTFCRCHQTLCYTCLETMSQYSNVCPWDKTRWTGRNLMKKFEESTPENYLQIRKRIQQEETFEKMNLELLATQSSSSLQSSRNNTSSAGLGAVRLDDEYAITLQEEERMRYEELVNIEREDYKLAKQLSFQLSEEDSAGSREDGSLPTPKKRSVFELHCSSSNGNQCNHSSFLHSHPLHSYSVRKKNRIEMYFQKPNREGSGTNFLMMNDRQSPQFEEKESIKWICKYCTYENLECSRKCEICGNK